MSDAKRDVMNLLCDYATGGCVVDRNLIAIVEQEISLLRGERDECRRLLREAAMSDDDDMVTCEHCGQRYQVIWNVCWDRPTYCPFCGRETKAGGGDDKQTNHTL